MSHAGGGCHGFGCLVPTWAGTARITSVHAIPGSHAVQTMALVRFAGNDMECLQAPGQAQGRVRGLNLLRRGVDSLRKQLARAAYAPFAGPGISSGSAAVDPGQSAEGAALIQARGSHRAIAAADAACPSSYRGFLVRHPPPSYWRSSIPASVVVRTLTIRTLMPGGRPRLKHDRPMADGTAGRMQRSSVASADPAQDGIRFLSQFGPGRQDSLAGALRPGVFSGIPRRAAWWPARPG